MKIFLKKKLTAFLIIFLITFLLPQLLLGATTDAPIADFYGLEKTATIAGLSTARTDLGGMLGDVVNYLFGIVGVIFLTVILIGGYMWLTAGGNEEKVKKAKEFIINGINGMIVIFLAYALAYIMIAALKLATE
ncbi:MAG: hypothetical protein A3J62_01150 [Candidatus Buchananbacteria bacterium RIFCSPHIGHO2_02_FULL_38_8]|uniref:Uncharacterized protein n=2 Tax=Candidatus Buchananiibacteriota TaxID=1817903 RepID=A0A1G1XX71_9BACT|nr:MAG: hypothetical protein A2731_03120 [Candidatus Buchananbacteria bacterium RIFCSPHIGHO2_01_FULL_39_8]OGY47549.1 MAG: hypothetical protein A3J62_01150 [Candidatus Buchananbacteria bacterium RIFCSPHIGHO2_02_FULL_38_8]